MNRDVKKLEMLTEKFGIKEYYGLFACIITGRSWKAINNGIDKIKITKAEVKLEKRKIMFFMALKFNYYFSKMKYRRMLPSTFGRFLIF
jgi:hypothetical protein